VTQYNNSYTALYLMKREAVCWIGSNHSGPIILMGI